MRIKLDQIYGVISGQNSFYILVRLSGKTLMTFTFIYY